MTRDTVQMRCPACGTLLPLERGLRFPTHVGRADQRQWCPRSGTPATLMDVSPKKRPPERR